jgi:hypothetical protein
MRIGHWTRVQRTFRCCNRDFSAARERKYQPFDLSPVTTGRRTAGNRQKRAVAYFQEVANGQLGNALRQWTEPARFCPCARLDFYDWY